MKRCPTCDKTFDDNLKFCQIDGTALVDDVVEAVDPYKTMVASKDEIAAAMSSLNKPAEISEKETSDDEVLDIPTSFDAGKTQVVSEAELRSEMEKASVENEQVIDVPPVPERPAILEPESAKFDEPDSSTPEFSSPPPDQFAQSSPAIPSPFEVVEPVAKQEESKPEPEAAKPVTQAAEPVPPSPFGDPIPASPFSEQPANEPSTANTSFAPEEPEYNPFEHSAPVAAQTPARSQSTPPAVQQSNMQNPQNMAQNASSPNQTLAIVSLVVGILSIFCCSWFIPGIAAIILGFLAKSKASNDPANYGGSGLAMGGIITGVLSLILGVVVIVLYLFMGVGANLMQGF